jgi:hypothetical protein
MIHPGKDQGLLPKSSQPVGVCNESFGQGLDRNFAAEIRIPGFPHFSHTALADGGKDLVLTKSGAWLHSALHIPCDRANATKSVKPSRTIVKNGASRRRQW